VQGFGGGQIRRKCMRDNGAAAKSRLLSVLLTVSALLLFGVSSSTARDNGGLNGMIVLPADPKLDWSLAVSYGAQGRCTPICKLMTSLAMDRAAQHPTLCGILEGPRAEKAGIVLPSWRKQDYQLHDDEIRKSFLAGLYPADDLMELMAKRYPSESAQQLRERIWTQYQSAILELFKKGDAEYDITSFDIDGDRVPETLSRISMIEPVMQGLSKYANGKIKWQVRTCMDNSKYAEFTLYLNGSATGSSNNYFQQLRTSFRLVGDEAIIFRYQAASYLMSQDFMVSSSERSGDEYVSEIHWTGLFEKRKTRFLDHSVVTWGQGDSP
jgi:hypothetical protein